MSMVRADGFCVIPQESEGYEAGDTVEVTLLCSPEEIDRTIVCTGSHDMLLDVISDLIYKIIGLILLYASLIMSLWSGWDYVYKNKNLIQQG